MSEIIYGIYSIRCKLTNKYYIGQTLGKYGIHCRWKCHIKNLNQNTHHSPKLQNAWNKYSTEAFEFNIIHIVKLNFPRIELDTLEIDYILKYNSFLDGYNSTSGGSGGRTVSKETKQLIGSYHKGKVISDKQKQQISEFHKGKPKSEETKRKMSLSAKGKKHGPQSKEAKEKIALSNKTRPNRFPTEEHRAKLRLAQARRKEAKLLKT